MADHILTDEEREFLSSFSYCPSDYKTLQDWAESWGSRVDSADQVRSMLTDTYSGLHQLLKQAMVLRTKEPEEEPGPIDFTDEEVVVLTTVGSWGHEDVSSTGTLLRAARTGGGNAHNVIKRLVSLLVIEHKRDDLAEYKDRVRNKAKEVAKEMTWCLEGVNRTLRSLDIEEWETLEDIVDVDVIINVKINASFSVRETIDTMYDDVREYLRSNTIPYDDFDYTIV